MPGSRGQTPASTSSGGSPSRASTTLNGRLASSNTSPRQSSEAQEDAETHGTARRSHRLDGSAGGFLLGSLTSRVRASPTSRQYGSLKGKGRGPQEKVVTPQRHSTYGLAYQSNVSPSERDGGSTGEAGSRGQSSRGTPERLERPVSYSPYMNQGKRHQPADLVNIALQLNQSRQRQTSARFQPQSIGAALNDRTNPSGIAAPPTFNGTKDTQRDSSYGARNVAIGAGTEQQAEEGREGSLELGDSAEPDIEPTPQTLIRAERAKIALELRYHHRRVLQHLPRLPASNPAERPTTNRSAKGDDPSQAIFGRAYNPLQYARNRRLRLQKRSPLKPEKDGWNDVDRVVIWVNEVAAQRDVRISSLHDNYPLPYFGGGSGSQLLESSKATIQDTGRPNPENRVPLPPNDWTIGAQELLADVYWLQQNDNRCLVTGNNQEKLFPSSTKVQATRDGRSRSTSNSRGQHESKLRPSSDSGRGSVTIGRANEAVSSNFSPRRLMETTIKKSPKPSNRRISKVDNFISRRSRAASDSSSESDHSERRKISRPWSKTFSRNWEDRIPERKSFDERRKPQEPSRKSLEVSETRHSYESRPFSIELQPPEEDKGPALLKQDTFSDLDTTAPNSPIQAPIVPSLALDFDARKIFGSSPEKQSKHRNKSPSDRHHQVQQKDFAEDPFREEGERKERSRVPKRGHITTLSNGSEASFSLDSDKRQAHHFKRQGTDRAKSPNDGSFHIHKPWKAGKYMAGRVGDLLRRKDYASDTSETDDDNNRQKNLRQQVSRTNTMSSAGRGTLSRSSTLSAVGESPGYRPPELPTFFPLRREGNTGSPSRVNTNESILQRLSTHVEPGKFLSPDSAGAKSPVRSLTPQLKRMATGESKDFSENPLSPTTSGTGRRGATFTDASGQQWPRANRSVTAPWPGEDSANVDKTIWYGPELRPTRADVVTIADITRTRTIIQSACIKATKASTLLQLPPSQPTPFLREIWKQYDSNQVPIAKLDAIRVLSQHLIQEVDTNVSSLNQAAENFISKDVGQLDRQLDGVKSIVHDKLTAMVLSAGETADALGNEISAGLTREVRDLNDSIDQLVRARRRRGRWLRQSAWWILEWITVTLMYVVWLCWTLFKTVRGLLRFVIWVVRWLFLL